MLLAVALRPLALARTMRSLAGMSFGRERMNVVRADLGRAIARTVADFREKWRRNRRGKCAVRSQRAIRPHRSQLSSSRRADGQQEPRLARRGGVHSYRGRPPESRVEESRESAPGQMAALHVLPTGHASPGGAAGPSHL